MYGETTNSDRATWAGEAFDAYVATGKYGDPVTPSESDETIFADLICDLMHYGRLRLHLTQEEVEAKLQRAIAMNETERDQDADESEGN